MIIGNLRGNIAARQALALTTGVSMLALLAGPAMAQDVAPATEAAIGGIEEIVVTARKRSENLQKVPIAITAFTRLATRQIRAQRRDRRHLAVQRLDASAVGIHPRDRPERFCLQS
jgi:outer membrane receptor protein involved in Fe transport